MLEQPLIEKLLSMRLQGMADALEDAGTRLRCPGTEFRRAPVLVSGSTVELAREPGAGSDD